MVKIFFILFILLQFFLYPSDTAKVIYVFDGDTIEVRFQDGKTEIVRMIGIDCPESLKENNPDEYPGIEDPNYLYNWALFIKRFTRAQLQGKIVTLIYDDITGLRGIYGRLLAYVYLDETNYNQLLIKKGYARAYVEKPCKYLEEFILYQNTAMENRIGLWTGVFNDKIDNKLLKILNVHYDAKGNDHQNLNDEYFFIKNISTLKIDFSGWHIEDNEKKHIFCFPQGFTLDPGSSVIIYTGTGENTQNKLYWCHNMAILNNAGDIISIFNSDNLLVNQYKW